MYNQQINLDYVDEIETGLRLYRLSIDGCPIRKRVFFRACVFDTDHSQIAITQYSFGDEDLESTLWVIDLETKLAFEVSKQANAYLEPVRFEGSKLIYCARTIGETDQEFECDFSGISPTNL